jgi:hypothetical protein
VIGSFCGGLLCNGSFCDGPFSDGTLCRVRSFLPRCSTGIRSAIVAPWGQECCNTVLYRDQERCYTVSPLGSGVLYQGVLQGSGALL